MGRQISDLPFLLANEIRNDDTFLVRDKSSQIDKQFSFKSLVDGVKNDLPEKTVEVNDITVTPKQADANGWRSVKLAKNLTVYWQKYEFFQNLEGNSWPDGQGKAAPIGIKGLIFGTVTGYCTDGAVVVSSNVRPDGSIEVKLQNKYGANVPAYCSVQAVIYSIT